MTTLVVILALAALGAWWLHRLVATVRLDGYASRRPPASRHDAEGDVPGLVPR